MSSLTCADVVLAMSCQFKDYWQTVNKLGLTRDDLIDPVQQEIWDAIAKVEADGVEHNPAQVAIRCDTINSQTRLEGYLDESQQRWIQNLDATEIVKSVLADSRLRFVRILSNSISLELKNVVGGANVSTIRNSCADLLSKLDNLTELRSTKDRENSDVAVEYVTELQQRLEDSISGRSALVKTGIASLDEAMGGGFDKHRYIIVAGRTGVGKTHFAINSLYNAIESGSKTLFFSAEMQEKDIMDRLCSRYTGIPVSLLKLGVFNDEQSDKIAYFTRKINDSKEMKIYSGFGNCIDSIENMVDIAFRHPDQPKLCIFDYAQMLKPNKPFREQLQNLQYVSSSFRRMATRYPAAFLVLAQLNRNSMQEAPEIHHIMGNDSFAHDCDAAILLYANEDCRELGFSFARLRKMRFGTEKNVPMHTDLSTSKFTEIPAESMNRIMTEYTSKQDARVKKYPERKKKPFNPQSPHDR